MLGLRHDIANLLSVLTRLDSEQATMSKYKGQVQNIAKAWDRELKSESEELFNRLFKQNSVTFSERILDSVAETNDPDQTTIPKFAAE